jgi:LEA14-like dessication related protein
MRPLSALRTPLALLAAAALVAAACSRIEAPIVKIEGAKMLKLGIAGSSLELTLRVQNPNTKPLRVERFEYEVSINDVPLGRGFYADPVEIEGFRDATVQSKFELSMLSIPATIKAIRDRGEARARIRGQLHLMGGLVPRRVPFEAEARIDLPGDGTPPAPAPGR